MVVIDLSNYLTCRSNYIAVCAKESLLAAFQNQAGANVPPSGAVPLPLMLNWSIASTPLVYGRKKQLYIKGNNLN